MLNVILGIWGRFGRAILTLPRVAFAHACGDNNDFNMQTKIERWYNWALVFAAFSLVFIYLGQLLSMVTQPWNGLRLAGAFTLYHGYPLYDTPGEVPLTGWIYGPLAALVYLPVALVANEPTTAILLGCLFTSVVYFLPVAVFLRMYFRERQLFAGLFLTFALYSFYAPELSETLFLIGGDCWAIALGFAAFGLLLFRKDPNDTKILMLSAACGALSIWSKQNLLPIYAALPFYFLVFEERKTALKFLAYFVFFATVYAVIFSLAFGAEKLWYNGVRIGGGMPFEHPNRGPVPFSQKFSRIAGAVLSHMARHFALLTAIAAAVYLHFKSEPRRTISQNPVAVITVFYVCMVPLSVLARAKWGGAENTVAPIVFLLLMASLLFIGRLEKVKLILTACLFLIPITQVKKIWSLTWAPAQMRQGLDQTVFDYIRETKPNAYFPYNPLATMMADGSLLPVYYGLLDLEITGVDFDFSRIAEVIPKDKDRLIATAVVREYNWGENIRVGAGFSTVSADDPKLPGWGIYYRKEKNL